MARETAEDSLTPDDRRVVDIAIAVLRQLICLYGYEIHFGSFRPTRELDGMRELLYGATLGELQAALVRVLIHLHTAEKAQGE